MLGKMAMLPVMISVLAIVGSSDMFPQGEAEIKPTYDPIVVEYVEGLISQPGRNVEELTVADETLSYTTVVEQVGDNNYIIRTVTEINGNRTGTDLFEVVANHDGTFELRNQHIGTRTFTDTISRDATTKGFGHSTFQGAEISLYDRGYGLPDELVLTDAYSGCGGNNQATFHASVRSDLVDASWVANPFYNHWCLVPHQFSHGSVQYGTETYDFEGQSERYGFRTFTNHQENADWHSLTVDFFYEW